MDRLKIQAMWYTKKISFLGPEGPSKSELPSKVPETNIWTRALGWPIKTCHTHEDATNRKPTGSQIWVVKGKPPGCVLRWWCFPTSHIGHSMEQAPGQRETRYLVMVSVLLSNTVRKTAGYCKSVLSYEDNTSSFQCTWQYWLCRFHDRSGHTAECSGSWAVISRRSC